MKEKFCLHLKLLSAYPPHPVSADTHHKQQLQLLKSYRMKLAGFFFNH